MFHHVSSLFNEFWRFPEQFSQRGSPKTGSEPHFQEFQTLSDHYAAEISKLDEHCKDLRSFHCFVSNAATRHSLIRRGAWCAFCLFLPCNWHGKILCMKYTDSNLEEYAFQPVVADWQIETDQMTCKTSDTYFSLPRNLCVDLCHTSYYLYYCYYCVSESFKIVDRCEELRKDQKGVKECHEVCWPMSNQALFQGISSPWTIWEFSIFHPCWLFWDCQDFDAEPFLNAKCREVLNWKLAFRQLWAPRNSIAYLGAIQFIVPWWPHL